MDDLNAQSEVDVHVQELLLAASQHNLTTLRHLLRLYSFPDCNSVDVQDPETGYSPLHAAIAACENDDHEEITADFTSASGIPPSESRNGITTLTDQTSDSELILGAKETIKCLLQNGAIWNQLDKSNETPGCIAYRLGLRELYELLVDAGVRAELLLNRLEGYEKLEDEDDADAEEVRPVETNGIATSLSQTEQPQAQVESGELSNTQYLSSALSIEAGKILDEQSNGVMMDWESSLMKKSADALLTRPDMRVLNIGFGMGIIDNSFQSHPNKPASHHIVEAHPAVLADMKAKGWHDKTGVVVHEGRWQDILPKLVMEGQTFEAIYFDTFAESCSDFRDFFSEQVIALMDPDGRFSYFNGMGADRQISYDVYQKVVEMDLFEAGFDVDWEEVEIPNLDDGWEGVKRKYWNVEKYRLAVCRFMD
jgi:type IV protein arginine methyltransferase